MNINLGILNAEKKLRDGDVIEIERISKKHLEIAMSVLKIKNINVSIYPNKEWCIKETGDGGYTAASDWVQLFIDPSKKNSFHSILKNSFPANIYHEIHHSKRMSCAGYGETLLEVVVSEGLAMHFAKKMYPQFIPPWTKYRDEELKEMFRLFNKHKNKTFDYSEWFLGYGKQHWLGYKIGFHLVDKYIRHTAKISKIFFCEVDASEIFNEWYNSSEDKNLK